MRLDQQFNRLPILVMALIAFVVIFAITQVGLLLLGVGGVTLRGLVPAALVAFVVAVTAINLRRKSRADR